MELKNNVTGIVTHLAERGKIKLGESTGTGNIKYLDYMRVKKNYKVNNAFVSDDEVHEKYGESEDKTKIKKLMIKFPYNDIELIMSSFYTQRMGKKLTGKGDNSKFYIRDDKGNWKEIPRPEAQLKDDYKEADKWSLNLFLNCKIVGFETVGSVYILRSKSYNNYISLRASLERIRDLTEGQLMEIEFQLSVIRARNSKGVHAQVFLDYLGSEYELAKKAAEIKVEFAKVYNMQFAYEQNLKERLSKDFEVDQFGEDEDIDKEFGGDGNSEITALQELNNNETTEIKESESEEISEIPDLTLPNQDEVISKIGKMRTDAIARVNECKTIAELEKLKSGIGYKEDFGNLKAEADAVIIDVLEIINTKIQELKPTKTEMRKENHEQLKEKLIELGLNHESLRKQFYQYFGSNEQYLEKPELLLENVEKYKKSKLLGKKTGLLNKIEEKFNELQSMVPELLEQEYVDDVKYQYSLIDQTNFKDVWEFWLCLEGEKEKE